MEPSVVVVGAGLAGLSAARALRSAGRPVVVVDKGRGVGGRLATRRIGEATLDHGAPRLDLDPPEHWPPAAREALAVVGPGRWRALPSMTALPKALAVDLDVRLGVAVAAIERAGTGWRVVPAAEHPADAPFHQPLEAAAVVVTAPVPQARALLAAGGVAVDDAAAAALDGVGYRPALVALLPGASLAASVGEEVVLDDEVVARVVDHHRRGTSAVPAVTVEATAEWSATHLDDAPEPVLDALVAAAGRCGVEPAAAGAARQLHRWRYARVERGLDVPVLALDPAGSLVLAGDAYGPGDAAGAVASGAAAAVRVLDRLGPP